MRVCIYSHRQIFVPAFIYAVVLKLCSHRTMKVTPSLFQADILHLLWTSFDLPQVYTHIFDFSPWHCYLGHPTRVGLFSHLFPNKHPWLYSWNKTLYQLWYLPIDVLNLINHWFFTWGSDKNSRKYVLSSWELLTFSISINLYWDLAFHSSVNVSTAQSSINSIYDSVTVEIMTFQSQYSYICSLVILSITNGF